MNLLNEEIRAIKNTMSHLKMAIPLESDSGKKLKLQNDLKELGEVLNEKLEQCGEFKG